LPDYRSKFYGQSWLGYTCTGKTINSGGRARQLKEEGFTFDMGPSWYWMADVFERYFAQFGKKATDYYQLQRLDPSYRIFWPDEYTDIPANLSDFKIYWKNGNLVLLRNWSDF
jgi:phytoene desaturase